jgi:hypothetical protein
MYWGHPGDVSQEIERDSVDLRFRRVKSANSKHLSTRGTSHCNIDEEDCAHDSARTPEKPKKNLINNC